MSVAERQRVLSFHWAHGMRALPQEWQGQTLRPHLPYASSLTGLEEHNCKKQTQKTRGYCPTQHSEEWLRDFVQGKKQSIRKERVSFFSPKELTSFERECGENQAQWHSWRKHFLLIRSNKLNCRPTSWPEKQGETAERDCPLVRICLKRWPQKLSHPNLILSDCWVMHAPGPCQKKIKQSTSNWWNLRARSPGRGHDNPLQYSCLENHHGQRSLEGYSPWGYTTERLGTAQQSMGWV